MYATSCASQFTKTIITMACSIQKQPLQPSTCSAAAAAVANISAEPKLPKSCLSGGGQRGSLPSAVTYQTPLEFQWPTMPVSMHTSNLRLNMMNQDPKDLHTARLMIEELRAKVRYQTEHIMKWRKAYALQIQQHYRYQKEKTDQMNALTSQLLLLESRLKRKQKQISSLLSHRELTIQRQQKIIDTLSTRLVDHGLETIEASYATTTELDSLNDSDSAVVMEDIDSDTNTMTLGNRRKSSGGGGGGGGGSGMGGGEGITIARSISDAIETNLNKYSGVRRNNCFLRRPDILETVYSVEEDPEPTTDVAEKRDKFRNRSEKALSSSSTEGQIDNVTPNAMHDKTKDMTTTGNTSGSSNGYPYSVQATRTSPKRQMSTTSTTITPLQHSPTKDGYTAFSVRVPQLQTTPASMDDSSIDVTTACQSGSSPERAVKSQVTNYNRVMSNHRSVTKPKDVKYKRINKAKSKSLEELRGRLKNLVERGGAGGGGGGAGMDTTMNGGGSGGYASRPNAMPQTAQSYA